MGEQSPRGLVSSRDRHASDRAHPRRALICAVALVTALAACSTPSATPRVSPEAAAEDPLRAALFAAQRLGHDDPWLVDKIARAFAAAGRCEEARQIATAMPEPSALWRRSWLPRALKARALAAVARCPACPERERVELATHALNLVSGLDPYYGEPVAEEIAAAFELLGMPDEARRAITLREEGRGVAFALVKVASELRKAGGRDRARVLLDEARETSAAIDDCTIRVRHRVAVAEELAAMGERAAALDLLAGTRAEAAEPGEGTSAQYAFERIGVVADSYTTIGELGLALEIAEAMPDAPHRDRRIENIVEKLLAAGRVDEAAALVVRLHDRDAADRARVALTTALAARKDADQALAVAREVDYATYRAEALATAAGALADEGRTEAAREVLAEALGSRIGRGAPITPLEVKGAAAVGYARLHDDDRARELFHEIGAEPGCSRVLKEAAVKLVSSGRPDLAIQAVAAISVPTYFDDGEDSTVEEDQAYALVEVAFALAGRDDEGSRDALRALVAVSEP